jgi:hypothetical protein
MYWIALRSIKTDPFSQDFENKNDLSNPSKPFFKIYECSVHVLFISGIHCFIYFSMKKEMTVDYYFPFWNPY